MKIYHGWIIVAASIGAYIIVIGTTFSSFSVFVVPVSHDLQLSRAEMNTVLVLLSGGSAIFAPLVGRMLDRFPARAITTAGALLMGVSFFALSISRSTLLSSVVIALPLAIGYLATGSLTMTVLIARWFVAQRARALALSSAGMSLATICMPPLVGFLVEEHGWRTTLAILAVVPIALLLLLTTLIRERPLSPEAEGGRVAGSSPRPDVTPPSPAPLASIPDILGTPLFWTMGGGVALMLGVLQALSISMVPLAMQGGLTLLQSTTLITLFGAGGFAGMLLFAAIGDKIDRLGLLVVLASVIASLNVVLLAGGSYVLLAICATALGFVSAPVTPAFYALLADRFGAASFGTVRGLMTPVIAIMGMFAIRLAGEIFDRTGGYDVMFAGFIAALVCAALLLLASRQRSPAAPSLAPIAEGSPPSSMASRPPR